MSDEMDNVWLDKATEFCLEARALLVQAKKAIRALEACKGSSESCLEQGFNEASARGNLFSVMMQAMGQGMILEGARKEAAYRDGQGMQWVAQVLAMLWETPGLRGSSPSQLADSLDAFCMASLQEYGIDYRKNLEKKLDHMEGQ